MMLTKNQKIDIMHKVPVLRGMNRLQKDHPKTGGCSRLADDETWFAKNGSVRNSVATLENSQPVIKAKKSDYNLAESPLGSIARDVNDRRISDENCFGQSMGPHAKKKGDFTEIGFHFDDIVAAFPDADPARSIESFWDELDRRSNRLNSRVKIAS